MLGLLTIYFFSMKRFFLSFLFIFISYIAHSHAYKTEIRSEQIRTLTVYADGDWSSVPVIKMGSENFVEISFDELSHDYKRYAYRVVHCNADWTRSDMNVLEYMEGFSENDMEDGRLSESTLTPYTHYTLSLPNDQVKLTLSGNYAVEIYEKDRADIVLLTACFSLSEEKVQIEGSVTATTDVDNKQSHQQLAFSVNAQSINVMQPLCELKVKVRQNHRTDNEVQNVQPLTVQSGLLKYEHNKDLIFEAGNEYRRFEMTTFKYPGIGINQISFFKPFYNVELLPAEKRLNGYLFDKDQNGRFLIRSQEALDNATGADYFLVHFSLPMETPILDGGIYLNGDLTNNNLDANGKMIYNFERKAYEKSLLLKQGAFNYQYLYRPVKSIKSTPLRIEGSYWETENEYQIYVYYRPSGERYDRLVGFKQIQTAF